MVLGFSGRSVDKLPTIVPTLVFLGLVVRNRRRRKLPRQGGPQRCFSHLRRLRHHIYGHVSFEIFSIANVQVCLHSLCLCTLGIEVIYYPLNFLLSGLTPSPMASSGASPTQQAAWGTRERGSGSSLDSSSDSDRSSELVGYSSGNISSQVSKYILRVRGRFWHKGVRRCTVQENYVRRKTVNLNHCISHGTVIL